MKDFRGETVGVGDTIFYSTTGRWPESRLCKVTRFTDKSIFAKVIKNNSNNKFQIGKEVIVKNSFVVVR